MFKIFGRAAATLAFAASALFLAGTASAEDRHVMVTNGTSYVLVQFYASNAGMLSWEEDILGVDVLMPGEQVMINIDDGTGACIFDFKGVFDDGDSVINYGIDVCSVTDYVFYEN